MVESLRYISKTIPTFAFEWNAVQHTHTHTRTLMDRDTHLSPCVITRHSTIQIHKLLGNRVGFSCIQRTLSEDFTSRHSAEVSDCGDRTVPQQKHNGLLSAELSALPQQIKHTSKKNKELGSSKKLHMHLGMP